MVLIIVMRRVSMNMIKRFFKDESGATMVEYAILVALIAIAVIATVMLVAGALNEKFIEICTKLGGTDCAP
jgi:pilus assembly protein Flp/PilA